MSVYKIGEEIELIKLEILDYTKYITTDIYIFIQLCLDGKVSINDIRLSKYKAKITSIINYPNDYYGYVSLLTHEYNRENYIDISQENIQLYCQKESYEKHRYLIAGLSDVNAYDYCWKNLEFSDFGGLYYLSEFINEKISSEFPEFISFLKKEID